MSDREPGALVARPASDLRRIDFGAEKVLSRIVSDALAIARERDVADMFARIRLGKYDFCQSDYRQIVAWAQETGKSPEELIRILENVEDKTANGIAFIVDDGSIKQVEFPGSLLFRKHIFNDGSSKAVALPGSLLFRKHMLKISDLQKLVKITCEGHQLAKIDLSNLPMLAVLSCPWNRAHRARPVQRSSLNKAVLRIEPAYRVRPVERPGANDVQLLRQSAHRARSVEIVH